MIGVLSKEKELAYVEDAKKFKDLANKAYDEHDYTTAIKNYHQCILNARVVTQSAPIGLPHMSVEAGNDEEPGMSDSAISPSSADTVEGTEAEASQSSELKKEAHDLVAKCYNNLAQCILNGPPRQKEDYMRAVYYCDSVIKMAGENGILKEKALFRKASALMKAEKYDKAIEQFEKCPQNVRANQLAEECRQKEREDRHRRDAEIRANFAKFRAAEQNADNGPTMNGSIH